MGDDEMNIYFLSQDENNDYDTFDSVIVCAENEEDAKRMHPSGEDGWGGAYPDWASSPDKVECTLIGVSCDNDIAPHVVLASFNAG